MTGLGGHGVAAIYEGREPGPTVMVRCELDALPIEEISESPHRSQAPGKSHACGHDGHMTMVAALSRGLGRQRPQRGRAVLLFQPAEENGAGAAAVIADPKFAEIAPDYAFSLHNKPGLPLGYITLSEGPANWPRRRTAESADRQDLACLHAGTRHLPGCGGSPADAGIDGARPRRSARCGLCGRPP